MRNLNIRQTMGFYALSLESHALDRSAILPCKLESVLNTWLSISTYRGCALDPQGMHSACDHHRSGKPIGITRRIIHSPPLPSIQCFRRPLRNSATVTAVRWIICVQRKSTHLGRVVLRVWVRTRSIRRLVAKQPTHLDCKLPGASYSTGEVTTRSGRRRLCDAVTFILASDEAATDFAQAGTVHMFGHATRLAARTLRNSYRVKRAV